MIGIKDIAKIAGVSVSTVSNVLNGRKNVGKATRERILQICAEQGYHPNIMGKNLKTGRKNTIVFNFSEFDRYFYLKIINGVHDYLKDNDYDLIICTDKSSKNFMRSSFASGAITLDRKLSDDFLKSVSGKNFPIILMDRVIDTEYTKSVIVDNYTVMCELVQALVNKGFKRFGFIGGPDYTLDNKERFAGFEDTLKKNNIPFDYKYYFHGNYREESGYQAVKIFILSHSLPEVLVCANDDMAFGAIRALEENNIRVPQDISVTGFDDGDLAEMVGLTTVSIPRYESGYLAAKELLEMIGGAVNAGPFKFSAKINWRGTVR
ncbi:Glucose-resistance amylase regulator [Chlamydia abortus]|uniref:LacI family DNA-binding transcriptional regulator n=1 Tax=Paenibacillus residui TaxID=629724 RepID=A0ABW3DD54_9BACL|nr:LacI family DNA-binding transcriptional regulator [Paenibacillus sp. 32O-W]SHE14411.1 Glucose-resistance amylase regulator [Chlamydia abortus]